MNIVFPVIFIVVPFCVWFYAFDTVWFATGESVYEAAFLLRRAFSLAWR
jgi:hypothetical protein